MNKIKNTNTTFIVMQWLLSMQRNDYRGGDTSKFENSKNMVMSVFIANAK